MAKELKNLNDLSPLKEGIKDELINNPVYSLEVDPEGKLKMSNLEKTFTNIMMRLGFSDFEKVKDNLMVACEQLGIDMEQARDMYWSMNVQNEMERISKAMVARRFSTKSMTLDNIKSYLTSMIIDNNVSMNNRLTERDKLSAIKLLSGIIQFDEEMALKNNQLDAIDIVDDDTLNELSLDEMKTLINGFDENKSKDIIAEKDMIISKINYYNPGLTMEQHRFLRTLPKEQLEARLESLVNKYENQSEEIEVVEEPESELLERLKKLSEEQNNE